MNKTALITGASGGIGADLARLFARDGWDVILVARSEAKMRELAQSLEQECGIKGHVVAADLTQHDSPDRLMAEAAQRGLTIDALVNNAGYGLAGAFAETDLATELAMIQLNVASLTHLTKLVLPSMVERRFGRIMNVASTAAFQPGPLMAVYYATKAYVLSFSEAIAEELEGTGVTVTALCPGPTETGFSSVARMDSSRLFNMFKPASSADVARIGYGGMQRGRRVVIPGLRNKAMMQSLRISPRRVVTKVVRKMQEGGGR